MDNSWLNREEQMRLASESLAEFREAGEAWVNAKKEYTLTRSKVIALLEGEGYSKTQAYDRSKVTEEVANAEFAMNMAEVLKDAAFEAVNIHKLAAKNYEADCQREYYGGNNG